MTTLHRLPTAGARTVRRMRHALWAAPALALITVFVYYPIAENVRLSLLKFSVFQPGTRFVGLDNYRQAFADPVFWKALANNLLFAVTSVTFQVGAALVLAAALEELVGRRLGGLLRTLYVVPAAVSMTVAGLLFQFLYQPDAGLVNSLLGAVGLDGWQRDWLGQPDTAIWGVIGMSQWQSFGYTTMLLTVAVQRIPRELYEAAYVDGAGRVRTFFTVTVPMVRQMTTLLVILTVSGAFLVFNEVMVMTGGGPSNSSQVLGTWLYTSAFTGDDMGYAAAVGTVLFALTFAAGAAQLCYSRRKAVEA
ncbi:MULTISPECIES: sugar ABC transporter permease [unclassified Streptomyces]|uniref:carbohydrate ABC transporter permease n=1 Tax=unclassified Streptomyces TaxID=2593676 RepID=UPI002DDABECF|nr:MULTISPECIES: sugar ABC transporter permease [unclassified Streptomyces]WSA90394.1 sugar ABC transporter permease [Streptomyces sp. NBC_01795]WSB74620.1 sugar ABC transporter permease [Streptomyces sp. NBC_01775]WSS16995.1 sugar ABC transporter permease [Streptomyces sp. NBC_01186]WSS45738.1 sugar ABC transporter permease [Streptomyces sp. NBC_01187]